MFILVHSKPRATSSLLRNHWGNSLSNHTLITYTTTKKVTLIPSRHTLLLANTPALRLLILIPSRTHNKSQQTHKRNLFNRVQGLHLLQKIIWNQYKSQSYSTHFDQSQTLSNLNSLKNSKTCVQNLNTQIFFSEYIQRCCLLSNLNNLIYCI